MKRSFLINIIFLVVINLLIKPFYIFGIDRVVQNKVSDGSYGLYFTLLGVSFLLQVFHDLGLSHFNNRHIAQNEHLIDKYFPRLFLLKLLLSLFYFVILLSLGHALGYTTRYFRMLILVGTIQVLFGWVAFFRSNISGLGLYMMDSFISILDRSLLILVCSILLFIPTFGPHFTIDWFIYAQVATMGATALFAFVVIRSRLGKMTWAIKPAFALLILKKSLPFAVAVLLMATYSWLDSVMIEQLLADGIYENDFYASAFRLFNIAFVISYLFSGLLLPMFSRLLKDKSAFGQLLQFSFELLMAGAITVAISCIFYRVEIMESLYTNGGAYSGMILAILMISFVLICALTPFSAVLTANDSLKHMNRAFMISVGVNILLNLILVPQFKAQGAAVATCFTQLSVVIALLILTKKELGYVLPAKVLVKILLFVLVLVGSALVIERVLPLGWLLKFCSTLMLGLFWAILFKLLDIRSLIQLIYLREN